MRLSIVLSVSWSINGKREIKEILGEKVVFEKMRKI